MKSARTPRAVAVSLLLAWLLVTTVLLGSGAGAGASSVGSGSQPGLFRASALEGTIDSSGERAILRSRYVTLNLAPLVGPDGWPISVEPGATLVLNLFPDVPLTAVLDSVELSPDTGFTWRGHVDGAPLSQVTMVVIDQIVVGNVASPQGFYQVRYAGGGVHAIHQIDQSAYPDEMEPIPVALPEGEPAGLEAGIVADDGSVIDVLVVYTGAARAAAGGTAAMHALINLAVAETNTAYANSLIGQRLNLVHAAEVAYGETGDVFADLTALRGTTDPYMNDVHVLRDTHAADEVVLIVENGGPYCGVAYHMSIVSATFDSWAFAVVARDCATGYYSFGHELGHNMGARHDWYVDTGTTPYSHAHGYVKRTSGWRTVMAYNTECSDNGTYCTRLPYWSNPDVTYGGAPMGVAEGAARAADNRKTLNKTALTVANFRQGSQPPLAPADLTATATSPQTIELSWTDRSHNETGFRIERSPNGSSGWATVAAVAAGITTYADGGLSPETSYSYRVRAYNDDGDSDPSNTADATTPAVLVGPLVIHDLIVDDDNQGQSSGNGNGLINCGESVELYVSLYNEGNTAADDVLAGVSGSDAYVSLEHNTTSDYPSVPPGGEAVNGDDFDYAVDPDTPFGHLAHFELEITAGNGGPWRQDLDLRVYCSANAPYHQYFPLVMR